jgi:hypothetical protein
VHHPSILLNNQRDAALSSRICSSLQGYSTCLKFKPVLKRTGILVMQTE